MQFSKKNRHDKQIKRDQVLCMDASTKTTHISAKSFLSFFQKSGIISAIITVTSIHQVPNKEHLE